MVFRNNGRKFILQHFALLNIASLGFDELRKPYVGLHSYSHKTSLSYKYPYSIPIVKIEIGVHLFYIIDVLLLKSLFSLFLCLAPVG